VALLVHSKWSPAQKKKSYFDNTICRTSAVARVEEIISNPLGFVAEKILHAITRANDEYVRSLFDFLEVRKNSVHTLPVTDWAAISWVLMTVYDADFGWPQA